MNVQTISVIKAITVFSIILFSNHFVFSQIKPNEQRMVHAHLKYGEIVELTIDEEVHFEDSLIVSLTSFSHKRPFTGGPTKATAYIALSRNNVSDEIMLSTHGIEGQSASKDGRSDSEPLDSLLWKEYEFQLMSFDYDNSIGILIYKKK